MYKTLSLIKFLNCFGRLAYFYLFSFFVEENSFIRFDKQNKKGTSNALKIFVKYKHTHKR